MYSKKINQLATNLNPQSSDLIPIGDSTTGQLKTITFGDLTGTSGVNNEIISGGIVTWTGVGLIFNVSSCVYYINGIRYNSPFTQVTLAAANPTYDRIDVFAVNTNNEVVVIQGTPSANPVEPEGDTDTTLGLTNVTVTAGSTTPILNRNLIYDENVESWNKNVSASAGTVNLADTTYHNTGSKSIRVVNGAGISQLYFSSPTTLNIADFSSLSFAIRLDSAWTSNQILSVRFYVTYSGNTASNLYQINSSNVVGFDRNLAGQWQFITIPLDGSIFTFTSNTFDTVRIQVTNAAATYNLDTISINGGINNPAGGKNFGYINGNTGTASATTTDDTLTIIGSGLAKTTASGKTLTISVPSTGTNNFVTKYTTSGTALGNSQIFDNGTSVGIGTTSPLSANLLQVEGIIASNTYKTYAGGTTLSNNVGSTQASVNYTFGGNATIPNSIVTSSVLALSNISFSASGTVTQSQAAQLRTVSNIYSQWSFSGTNNGTISHLANTRIGSPYSASSSTLTVTNYYGLVIEDSSQFSPFSITNKYGIYQYGAGDKNYFEGDFQLNKLSGTGTRMVVSDANGLLSTQTIPTGSGTVTSVAALTLGTTGTDLSSSVANSTTTPVITLNVPTASATNRGVLSSADWSTFNSKESVLTFSSPLSRTTNTISIPAATSSVNGYLTSSDWTTFNSKFTLPSLTNGSVLFSNGTTITQDNANLFWDDTNNFLGIGTASPVSTVTISTSSTATPRGLTIHQTSADSTAGLFTMRKSRGAGAVVNGDFIGNWFADAYDGTQYTSGGRLRFVVDGVVSNGVVPTAFQIHTGSSGTGTLRLTVSSAGVSTFTGDTIVSPVGSTTASPRVFGVDNYAAGNAARWQFGDSANSIQNSNGGRFILQSYWGMSIYGGRITAGVTGFETGAATDWSLNVLGTTAANPVLVVTGATSQTGNIQEWRNSSATILGAITSGGSLLVGGNTSSASAIVRLDSTSKGFLPPRMTSLQRTGIASPDTGLMVYQTDGAGQGIWVRTSTAWVQLSSSGATGTVTDMSIVTANGFAGTIANSTTTPAVTLSTTVTGMLKGDGTSISAATLGTDYVNSNIYTANGALTSPRTVDLVESNLYLGTAANTVNFVYVKKGVVPAMQVLTLAADRTLTNTTSQQPFFLTLFNTLNVVDNQTYFFEGLYYITTMSATSGNITLDMKGAGTAVIASIMYATYGLDNNTPTTAAALSGGVSVTSTFTAPVTAGTGTGLFVSFKGTFRIAAGGGGTFIPSIGLTTAVGTAVAKANSFFRMYTIADAANSKTEI